MKHEDYVIEQKHNSRSHPNDFSGTNTFKVVGIFTSKESAELELKKDKYEWRGNSTGSVGYSVRERKEGDKL